VTTAPRWRRARAKGGVFLNLCVVLLLTSKIEIKSNVANMVHDYSYTFTIRRLETFRR